jgi:hypothetical protein
MKISILFLFFLIFFSLSAVPGFAQVTNPWFVRMPNGWKDLDGKTWFDEKRTNISQYDSEKYCNDKNEALPSKVDFEIAETHGIREVFAEEIHTYWFWTSTPYPGYPDFAYAFDTSNGGIQYGYRNSSYYATVARCVNR